MGLIGEYGYPVMKVGGKKQLLSDAGVFQDAMELLQLRLGQDFLNVWASIPESWSRERKFTYLTNQLADLQLVYGSDASSMAAEFLNVQRDGENLPLVLAEPANMERIQSAVGWSMSKPDTQSLLWGAMQRLANEPYRETIRQSAWAAGNGFARVPEPGACSFCLMLASRGAVYPSKDAALRAGRGTAAARGSQSTGEPYHDHCHCTAIEVSKKSGLTEANIYLNDLWQQTFYDGATATQSSQKKRLKQWSNSADQRDIWKQTLAETKLPWLSSEQLQKPS